MADTFIDKVMKKLGMGTPAPAKKADAATQNTTDPATDTSTDTSPDTSADDTTNDTTAGGSGVAAAAGADEQTDDATTTNTETQDMAEQTKNSAPTPPTAPTPPAPPAITGEQAVAAERHRVKDINAAFGRDPAFCGEAIDAGWTLPQAKAEKFDRDEAARAEDARIDQALRGAGKSNNRIGFSTTEGRGSSQQPQQRQSTQGGPRGAAQPGGVGSTVGKITAGQQGDAGPIENAENWDQVFSTYISRGFSKADALKHGQDNHRDLWNDHKMTMGEEYERLHPKAGQRRQEAFARLG